MKVQDPKLNSHGEAYFKQRMKELDEAEVKDKKRLRRNARRRKYFVDKNGVRRRKSEKKARASRENGKLSQGRPRKRFTAAGAIAHAEKRMSAVKLRERARTYSGEAIEVLAKVMRNPKEKTADRVNAARFILSKTLPDLKAQEIQVTGKKQVMISLGLVQDAQVVDGEAKAKQLPNGEVKAMPQVDQATNRTRIAPSASQ